MYVGGIHNKTMKVTLIINQHPPPWFGSWKLSEALHPNDLDLSPWKMKAQHTFYESEDPKVRSNSPKGRGWYIMNTC